MTDSYDALDASKGAAVRAALGEPSGAAPVGKRAHLEDEEDTARGLRAWIDRHPLVALLGAIAFGYAVGRALGLTALRDPACTDPVPS